MRLIVGYKLARGVGTLLVAALLVGLEVTGHASSVEVAAERLSRHLTSAWSLSLAELVVRALAPGRLLLVAGALAVDGVSALLEGSALRLGWWWGPWLVVGATALFVPLEVVALARHLAWGRLLLLVANVLVALYLARRALRRAHLERHGG